jgi:hypothetical protein
MQPNQYHNYRRLLKRLVIVVSILLIGFIIFVVWQSQKFHVVSTNPNTNNVASVAPFFKVNFNEPLSGKSLSVSSSYSIVRSYSVRGKTLVITLSPPMTVGYSYYIKINSISDKNGQLIKDKVFTFVPKFTPGQSLPSDQQKALLKAQANIPRSAANITFTGMDSLLNVGVSQAQTTNLEQDFFAFAAQTNAVSIDTSSVAVTPHDPTSTSTENSANFSVTVDSTPYNATINYSNSDDSVRLFLYNPQNGMLLFDSDVPPPNDTD